MNENKVLVLMWLWWPIEHCFIMLDKAGQHAFIVMKRLAKNHSHWHWRSSCFVLIIGGAEPNLLPSFRILNSELVSFVSTPL
jgi:hypothetical protein